MRLCSIITGLYIECRHGLQWFVKPALTVWSDCFSEHFNSEEAAQIKQQYKQFKLMMLEDKFKGLLAMRFHPFWSHMKTHFNDAFHLLLTLVTLVLLIPMDTSECERGFALMNRLKTAMRNRLGLNHLNDLMTICMLGPDISTLNLKEVLTYWYAQKKKGRFLNAKFNDF